MPKIGFVVKDFSVQQGKCVVSKINLTLKSGDILGIVGRSGSGKSTFMKGLLGQVKVLSGEVEINCDDAKSDLISHLGYSPQENSLYSFLTLEENITVFGQIYGLKKDEIKKQTAMLLERLDLVAARDKKVIHLSGGMQKRADLAVTLVHNPDIIILDEPFNGLDISLQKFLWDFFRELAARGKIIMISSHQLNDLSKNCNQFALIEDGVFYNTSQILSLLKSNRITNLEEFLQKIFTRSILVDSGAKK
ncbi:MAG: ABC transporter ATP-binding protein [Candidatus Nanoarchaeia archaeon]